MATRPLVVAFDVIETLFSLSALERRFQDAGLSPDKVPLWFARLLRDGFALEIAGRFESFQTVAESSLRVLLDQQGLADAGAKIPDILSGFSELQPHPDLAPAVRKLRGAGIRLVALTNGSAKTTAELLKRAGVDGDFERVHSIDDVRHWKPAREVYSHAAEATRAAPGRLALVAAHAWDLQGAKSAGLTTAWVPRREKLLTPVMERPDVQGRGLEEVAAALLALPELVG